MGFNDGFVEISGAMGGFIAAFSDYFLVGFAGLLVGLAGSISMGAAAFLAARSASEFEEIEERKKEILEQINFKKPEKKVLIHKESPLSQGIYVSIFYFSAALLPVLPFLLGAQNIIFPVIIGVVIVLLLSFLTAFFAGEDFLRQLKLNATIIIIAILATYPIGYLAKIILGVEI